MWSCLDRKTMKNTLICSCVYERRFFFPGILLSRTGILIENTTRNLSNCAVSIVTSTVTTSLSIDPLKTAVPTRHLNPAPVDGTLDSGGGDDGRGLSDGDGGDELREEVRTELYFKLMKAKFGMCLSVCLSFCLSVLSVCVFLCFCVLFSYGTFHDRNHALLYVHPKFHSRHV